MKIAIASDHGGFDLKCAIKEELVAAGIDVVDLGTDSKDSVDYPDYGINCATAVANGEADRGIVFCGTGIGISIAANKVKGIRCALCTSVDMAKLSRQHNDANMLSLGGRITSIEEGKEIVKAWLETDFEGDRHRRRIDKISDYEIEK